jgi:hypothetical protein
MRFLAASRPRRDEAAAWLAAMARWGHARGEAETALAPWREDLWERAAARLSAPPPEGRAAPSPLLNPALETDA